MPSTRRPVFYGDTVVRAAFVIALLGWGAGFYGPPVFLHAVMARTGWSLSLVSAAVTFHFLVGAGVVICLPGWHRRFGIPATTQGGAVVLALGVAGWAAAAQPWQLFVAAALTGGGWVPLGAAGINAIISPWFVARRPLALGKAYNGASVGGMVFSPLWAAMIERYGFPVAALCVGTVLVGMVAIIAHTVLPKSPSTQSPLADGTDGSDTEAGAPPPARDGTLRWSDRGFLTLAAAMSLGLFAQIGLIAQLFSLMVPGLGRQQAGAIMALATGCGMGGRLVMARVVGPRANRRLAAACSYGVQAVGTALMLLAGAHHAGILVLGIILFGLGIGNATSMPPLIAQSEFAPPEVPRVVARCVAVAQALYAFAPMVFAAVLSHGAAGAPLLGTNTGPFFAMVLLLQVLAAACVLAGGTAPARRR
ncbi:MFS transporter [Acidovorax sp. sif1233]|uniref:MFS transporter n=1 Tax=Acidovorax sp. sif1233 TaxID=2854792 RepID=UPI001C45DB97|nr:MFS transporter [Acidovorax sp. sif1233]MBV7456007.1 MFS transporter [Acidovorax sp. sif1233]